MSDTVKEKRELPPAEERRLLAVVFVDVVGFSSLVEQDEAGTHRQWSQIRREVIAPQVSSQRGHIIKSTGDGYLIEFASAIDAVRFALEAQRQLATAPPPDTNSIRLRTAVHIGDVIGEADDLYGDCVNIAARLQEHAEPGGIVISAAVHDQVQRSVEYEAVDLGRLDLKNIQRPVHAYKISTPGISFARLDLPMQANDGREPSIAVLPFRVLGATTVDPYFAEGIVHDIAESLAGLKDLRVISSSSTVALSEIVSDKGAIARRLKARYLVTGTIARVDVRFRMHVELSDVETHAIIWRDHYDVEQSEIFATQDAIASRIARSLLPRVRQSELERALRKRPEDLGAYDLMLQALHRLYRFSDHDFQLARELLERAIERDPTYSAPYAWLAYWQVFKIGQGYSRDLDVESREAQRLAQLSLDQNPADPLALAVFGHTLSFLFGEFDRALTYFDRAIAYSPSSALAWGLSSPTFFYLGEYGTAIQRAKRSLDLSPLDPLAFFFQTSLAIAHYLADSYPEALRWGQQVLAENPRYSANLRALTATLSALGRCEEAARVAQRLLDVEPHFTVSAFLARYPLRDRERLRRYGDDLLAAGVPS
jgi:class 3 adenylate cyclase/TolB-like protein/Tfp pilus assembly protein PilF